MMPYEKFCQEMLEANDDVVARFAGVPIEEVKNTTQANDEIKRNA